MRTGDDLVDMQHKELIRQINLLLLAMANGEGEYHVDTMLRFLAGYARQHFGYEEACMNRAHCPVAQANKAAHDQFIQKLETFQEQLKSTSSRNILITVQLMREMSNWIVNHIRRIDTQLRTCINTTRAQQA